MSYNSKLNQLILASALAATVGYTSPSIAQEAPKTPRADLIQILKNEQSLQQSESLNKALKAETPLKFQGLNNVNPPSLNFDITSAKPDNSAVLSKDDVNLLLGSVDSNFPKPKDLDTKINSLFSGRIIPQKSEDVMGTLFYNPESNTGTFKMQGKSFKGKRFAYMDLTTGYSVEGALKGNEVSIAFEQGYSPLTASKKRLVEFDVKDGKTHSYSASTLNGISKIRIAKNAAKQHNTVNPADSYTKTPSSQKDELQKLVEQKEAKKPEVKEPDTTLESKVKKHVKFVGKVEDPDGKIHHGILNLKFDYANKEISHKVRKDLYTFVGPNAGYTLSAPQIGNVSGVYNNSTRRANYNYSGLEEKGFDAKAPGKATIGVYKNEGKDAKGIETIVYGASVRLSNVDKTEVNEVVKTEEQKPIVKPEDKPKAEDVTPYVATCYKNLEEITVNGVTYKAKDLAKFDGNITYSPLSVGSFDTLSAKLTDAGKENYTLNIVRKDGSDVQKLFYSDGGNYSWQDEQTSTLEGMTSDVNSQEFKGWKLNNGWILGLGDAKTPIEITLNDKSDANAKYTCAVGEAYRSGEAKLINGIAGAVILGGVYNVTHAGGAAATGGNAGTIFGNPLIPR